MSKTLILTEKPSVARDFAKALGIPGGGDGFMENDRYIVTWAIGHLVELLEPHEYDGKWKKWSLSSLPILPERFRYKPVKKTKKQLSIVTRLLKRKNVEKIVIATDAGREGEVIARTILLSAGIDAEKFGNDKRFSRFWTSQALTSNVVREAMDRLKPAGEYDRLWRAGQARQISDWLIGMNGTRSATLRMGDLFSIGRVQTAVLALLVDRKRERDNFKPEPYWLLRARFQNESGTWWGLWFKGRKGQIAEEKQGKLIEEKISGKTGTVVSVDKQEKKQPPPPLHSLTDLQREANTRYGFSAKKTLTIAQGLYENKKCLSYPRTEARVLGTRNVAMAQKIVARLSQSYPKPFEQVINKNISVKNTRVFNDAALTDHHAIIPLAPLPSRASGDEQKIYDLVLKRFAAAFHADCEYEQTEIITEVEKETFRTRGKIILKPGWRVVYESGAGSVAESRSGAGSEKKSSGDDSEEQTLPAVTKGDPAKVEETRLEKKETLPPPEYTEALLLKDMTNPGRYVSENELKKIYRGDVGLGTQSTRAQIIETLLQRKYLARRKRYLLATDKGCLLIDTLRRFEKAKMLTSPEETARWERHLDRIARGEDSDSAFLAGIRSFVCQLVDEFKVRAHPITGHAPANQTFGKCPRCGADIIEGNRGFGCSNWRKADGGCRFVIWKTLAGRKIPVSVVKQLLEKGVTNPLDGFVSKSGKPFTARLRISKGKEEAAQVKFEFDPTI